jgi:hypothetical protein
MEEAVNKLSNFNYLSSEVHCSQGEEIREKKFSTKIPQEKSISILLRCIKCYNIITLGIDIDGNIVILNLDSGRHSCSNSNVINESDELTPSKLVDELTLQLIRTQYQDPNTGKLRRTYVDQAKELMYKIPVYKPTPVFQVRLSDIRDEKIRNELAELDNSELDDVMRNSIGRIFESIDEHYYNLSVRNLLQWEIVS